MILIGYDWRAQDWPRAPTGIHQRGPWRGEYLRGPGTPGNQVGEGEALSASASEARPSRLARFYALAPRSTELRDLRGEIAFFEEVRVWMAKMDAEERRAAGRRCPPTWSCTCVSSPPGRSRPATVIDIYEAAGHAQPGSVASG